MRVAAAVALAAAIGAIFALPRRQATAPAAALPEPTAAEPRVPADATLAR